MITIAITIIITIDITITITVAQQVEEVAGIMRDNMEKVLFAQTIITIIVMITRVMMMITMMIMITMTKVTPIITINDDDDYHAIEADYQVDDADQA